MGKNGGEEKIFSGRWLGTFFLLLDRVSVHNYRDFLVKFSFCMCRDHEAESQLCMDF